MQIFKMIFAPFIAIFKFINNYFKTMIFLLILFLLFGPKGEFKEPNLAQVDITGTITDARELLEKLQEIRQNPNIKGVLLYIDSPGGTLSPSVELALEVKKLKSIKKVVSYAASSMASGSYYAGVNADKIVANPGAFIGSIGVIMQVPNISELAQKIGISQQVVKAGEYKEIGTFARTWTQKEKEALQELADKSYELFTKDVASARNLDLNKTKIWADAKVFLGQDALEVGLIDKVGGYFEAKKELEIISKIDKPIWQEIPKIDQILNKLENKTKSTMLNLFSNLNAR